MKKTILFLGIVCLAMQSMAQWAPAGDKIKTSWGENLNPNKVLPEYPRPIMERSDWENLNGLWDYAVLPRGKQEPSQFAGKILVPFAIESSLSGVQQRVSEKEELWYKKTFNIPAKWKGKNILLHFGAVDWETEVYLNDIKIGTHTGGYTPFSFDITPFLNAGEQKLIVKVFDPADNGYQPHGKQVSRPNGIWYTPVTGIWQTVWLEPVNEKHIANVKNVPDIDNNKIKVDVCTHNTSNTDIVEVKIFDRGKLINSAKAAKGQSLSVNIPDAKLWSTDSPFLYDMEVNLYSKGKLVDRVKSYCAMRKISVNRDKFGIMRIQLNNKDCFHFGPLDQGWWPDGLYTAPTDEALLYDIQKTKDFGFNMIRKHVKVEPARWYTHCDRLGILVWQDMPSGDVRDTQWQQHKYFTGTEVTRSAESEANYRREWKEIMDYLYSYPCIAIWVPFNEAWGQFKTQEIVEWTMAYDPSRLVNPASGGNHFRVGDMLDIHHYPNPRITIVDPERVTVLGEYGGIGLAIENHLWQTDKNWGYIQFKSPKEVTDKYIEYAEQLKTMLRTVYSAAVYTQTTDVEGEVNGLITYDRKAIKMEEDRLRKINLEISNSLPLK